MRIGLRTLNSVAASGDMDRPLSMLIFRYLVNHVLINRDQILAFHGDRLCSILAQR